MRCRVRHCLVRCGTTGKDGKERIGSMRGTACRRNSEGGQSRTSNFSAPFDPASGKTLLDLEPW